MPAKQGKEDLRIQKTREAIHKTFEEMICEMDYEQISIKELAQRARINRKTFYLHYNTLDDLLREIQNEMAQNFIKRTQGLERPRDMDKITREFFLCSEELGKIGERITCSGNYKYISRKITNDIMNQTWKNGAASSAAPPLHSEHYHDICSTKHFGNLQTMGGRWKKNSP